MEFFEIKMNDELTAGTYIAKNAMSQRLCSAAMAESGGRMVTYQKSSFGQNLKATLRGIFR